MLRRELFNDEHDAFRDAVRTFITKEIEPYHAQWEKDQIVSRDVWLAAGRQGLLGLNVPEEYGGGDADYLFNVIFTEELAAGGWTGPSFAIHNDIITPYLQRYATEEQKRRWLPGICSGEIITAIAMTEPGAGSDLQGITTTATKGGDHYVLNGQKTFISSGIISDLVIVAARTSDEPGWQGLSLLVVERGMAGFERGRKLAKMGQKAQDTAELFFHDVRVPKANLLGEEGQGFVYLMANLPRERLVIAVGAVASMERVLEQTMAYCKDRTAFGRPIGKFQHNRFAIAEMATETQVARTFVDRCIAAHLTDELEAPEACMAKWWTTELQKRVVDQCVQLHGGYGYMMEYPIAQAYLDSRIQTIYGGTTEIMKEVVGRSLGF